MKKVLTAGKIQERRTITDEENLYSLRNLPKKLRTGEEMKEMRSEAETEPKTRGGKTEGKAEEGNK